MAAGNLVFNVTTNATTSVPNSIIQAQKQAQAYLNRNPLQVNVKTQGLNNLNLQKNLPLGKMANDAKDFEKSINAATSRVLAFSATVGSLYAIGAALKSIVSTTIEVEKALVDIKVVSGATGAEFNKLSKGIFDAAIRTSESFKNASSAALEFSRQGLSVNETLKRTQAALILTKTAGMSAEDAVSSLTATMNTFTSQIGDVTEVVDKMTAVDNAFAVSSKDLADGLSRVGNSSQEAGVSLNETLAAITALQQRTARGGSVIGNALKSIFTRVGRPENIELLNQLGVATQTVSGKSRDAISILKDLSNVYKTLGDSQRKQVSEQIAGLYQINQFQALLADLGSSYSIVDQAVQKATNSMGSSAARMSELNKTTDALIKQSLTNLTDLQAKVGSLSFDKPLKSLLGGMTAQGSVLSSLLDTMNQIGTPEEGAGAKFIKVFLDGVGKYISGPGMVTLIRVISPVLANIAMFTKNAFSSLSGSNQQLGAMKNLESDINRLLLTGNQYYAQRYLAAKNVVEAEKALQGLIRSGASIGAVAPMAQQIYQRGYRADRSSPTMISRPWLASAKSKMTGGSFATGLNPVVNEMKAIASSPDYSGNRNARPMPAKIKMGGRTKNVIVNSAEKIIPNFANTGDHAILNPRQRREMGLAAGYVPNYAKFNNLRVYHGSPKPIEGKISAQSNRDGGFSMGKAFYVTPSTSEANAYAGVNSGANVSMFKLNDPHSFDVNKKYSLEDLRKVLSPSGQRLIEHWDNKNYFQSGIGGYQFLQELSFSADAKRMKLNPKKAGINSAFRRYDDPEKAGQIVEFAVYNPDKALNSPFAGGYIPNLMAKIPRAALPELLKSKKFQSITYQKANGEVSDYDAAQWRVRRDKLVGGKPPGGASSWSEWDKRTNSLVFHSTKRGESEAKFRRLSMSGIKSVRANGENYDVFNRGYIPNYGIFNPDTIFSPDFAQRRPNLLQTAAARLAGFKIAPNLLDGDEISHDKLRNAKLSGRIIDLEGRASQDDSYRQATGGRFTGGRQLEIDKYQEAKLSKGIQRSIKAKTLLRTMGYPTSGKGVWSNLVGAADQFFQGGLYVGKTFRGGNSLQGAGIAMRELGDRPKMSSGRSVKGNRLNLNDMMIQQGIMNVDKRGNPIPEYRVDVMGTKSFNLFGKKFGGAIPLGFPIAKGDYNRHASGDIGFGDLLTRPGDWLGGLKAMGKALSAVSSMPERSRRGVNFGVDASARAVYELNPSNAEGVSGGLSSFHRTLFGAIGARAVSNNRVKEFTQEGKRIGQMQDRAAQVKAFESFQSRLRDFGAYDEFGHDKVAKNLTKFGFGVGFGQGPAVFGRGARRAFARRGFAGGYNPMADAISRESNYVNDSSIYADYVNTHKYSGPVVANRRDEPNRTSLLVQAGTRGAIPNFARRDNISNTMALDEMAMREFKMNQMASKGIDINDAIKRLGEKILTATDPAKIAKLQSRQSELKSLKGRFEQDLQVKEMMRLMKTDDVKMAQIAIRQAKKSKDTPLLAKLNATVKESGKFLKSTAANTKETNKQIRVARGKEQYEARFMSQSESVNSAINSRSGFKNIFRNPESILDSEIKKSGANLLANKGPKAKQTRENMLASIKMNKRGFSQTMGFGASFVLPMAAAGIEQMGGESNMGSKLASSTISGAGMLAPFGLPAMALGAAGGLAYGALQIPQAQSDLVKKKVLEKRDKKLAQVNQFDALMSEKVRLKDISENGGDVGAIRQSQRNIQEIQRSLTDKKLISAIDATPEEAAKVRDERDNQIKLEAVRGLIMERGSVLGQPRSAFGSGLTDIEKRAFKAYDKTNKGKRTVEMTAQEAARQSNDFLTNEEEGASIEALLRQDIFKGKNESELSGIVEKFNAANKDAETGAQAATDTFKELLSLTVLDDKAWNMIYKMERGSAKEDRRRIISDYLAGVQLEKKQQKETDEKIKRVTNVRKVSSGLELNLMTRNADNALQSASSKMAVTRGRMNLQGNGVFLSEEATALQELNLRGAEARNEYGDNQRSLVAGGVGSIKQIYDAIGNQRAKDPVLLEAIVAKANTASSPEDILSLLSHMENQLEVNDENLQILQEIKKIKHGITLENNSLNDSLKNTVDLLGEELASITKQAKIQRNISSFGGMRSIGQPNSLKGVGQDFGRLRSFAKIGSELDPAKDFLGGKEVKRQKDKLSIDSAASKYSIFDKLVSSGLSSEEAVSALGGRKGKFIAGLTSSVSTDLKAKNLSGAKGIALDYLANTNYGKNNPAMVTAIEKSESIRNIGSTLASGTRPSSPMELSSLNEVIKVINTLANLDTQSMAQDKVSADLKLGDMGSSSIPNAANIMSSSATSFESSVKSFGETVNILSQPLNAQTGGAINAPISLNLTVGDNGGQSDILNQRMEEFKKLLTQSVTELARKVFILAEKNNVVFAPQKSEIL